MGFKNICRYLGVTRKIVVSSYPYPKWLLLWGYGKLLFRSFVVSKRKTSRTHIFRENILGLEISFHNYPELIQLFEEIFVRQIYDKSPHATLIVDCGSNIGISVLYFKKRNPQCRIIAFEPEEDNFRLLQQNVRSNHLRNVTLNKVALADAKGEKFLVNPGSSTLNWMLSDVNDQINHQPVVVRSLSEYIDEPIGLLKIDVEGAENLIIDDLIRSGKIHFVETFVMEYHSGGDGYSKDVLIGKLESVGFRCSTDHPNGAPATDVIIAGTRK
jgi:FkbM family methyltransferase